MEKHEAKEVLLRQGRYTISPEYAKEICEAFGVEFEDKLIRTKLGYRENAYDPSLPRVDVMRLSEFIAKKLGVEPDEKTYCLAGRMSGEGSFRDLMSEAYAKNL